MKGDRVVDMSNLFIKTLPKTAAKVTASLLSLFLFLFPAAAEDTIQKNRETVAKDYIAAIDQIVPVKVEFRSSNDNLINKTEGFQVFAPLTSGTSLLIDDIPYGSASLATPVTTDLGVTVGVISYNREKSPAIATLKFYTAKAFGLATTQISFRCEESEFNTKPIIQLINTRLVVTQRRLRFDLMSNCNEPKINNKAVLKLYDFKKRNVVDYVDVENQRNIEVELDPDGMVVTAASNDTKRFAEEQKLWKQTNSDCVQALQKTPNKVDVCGPNANDPNAARVIVWQGPDGQLSHNDTCESANLEEYKSPDTYVSVCSTWRLIGTKYYYTTNFLFLHPSMRKPVEFTLEPVESSLSVANLNFNLGKKTASFNLDTSAAKVEVFGALLSLPPQPESTPGLMHPRIMHVQFNDRWQITEIKVTGDTATKVELSQPAMPKQ
jgi:hypothetical protein